MTDETEKTLANGTVVTITKTLDDSGTPDDITDDILSVYRQYDIWSGEVKTETIVRPLKPRPEWPGWDENGQIVQEGAVSVQIDGFTVHQGTAVVTWQLDVDEVRLFKLEREITSVSGSGTIIKTVKEWDENGLITVSQTRIRITADGVVETREFSIEEVMIDGERYAKVIAEDGSYAIVVNRVDPRVVEHYDTDGTLRMITTVTRTHDGREVTVSIKETADGYEVVRDNVTYTVVFSETDVLIYDSNGSLLATVSRGDDGGWSVI